MPYFRGEKGYFGAFSSDSGKIKAEINISHGGEAIRPPSHTQTGTLELVLKEWNQMSSP